MDNDREVDFGVVELDPDVGPLTVLARHMARANRPPWWKRLWNFVLRRKEPPPFRFNWEEDELMPRITTLAKPARPRARVFYVSEQIFREGDVVRFSNHGFGGQVIEVRPNAIVLKTMGPQKAAPKGADIFLVSKGSALAGESPASASFYISVGGNRSTRHGEPTGPPRRSAARSYASSRTRRTRSSPSRTTPRRSRGGSSASWTTAPPACWTRRRRGGNWTSRGSCPHGRTSPPTKASRCGCGPTLRGRRWRRRCG